MPELSCRTSQWSIGFSNIFSNKYIMNWYQKYSQNNQPYSQEDIKRIAKELIRGAWNTGLISQDSKYNGFEVRLVIDNERPLNELAWSLGEEAYYEIMAEIERELIRREERIFRRREKKLEGAGELAQIRDAIKGKTWEQAKREILKLMPMGDPPPRMKIKDEDAEAVFKRLYNVSKLGGFLDIEQLRYRSPFFEDGKQVLKRLSEIRNKELHGVRERTEKQLNDYEETQIYHALFGGEGEIPPSTIQVYRGVSRAGARIRPGDYVTPDRSYARSYMRGKKGAILREVLNTDDLIIGGIPGSYESVELIYYPRGFEPEEQKVEAPFTFREFYNQVNQISASAFNLSRTI